MEARIYSEEVHYSVQTENIPDELCVRPQWVVWHYEVRDGKPTKIPYSAETGMRASTTNLMTWARFEEALAVYRGNDYGGIGFVFSTGDPYTGIDLDKCRNAHTGEVEEWAQEWIDCFGGYVEASPSGTGVHMIVKGKTPHNGRKTVDGKTVEIYSVERFFTFTGVTL